MMVRSIVVAADNLKENQTKQMDVFIFSNKMNF